MNPGVTIRPLPASQAAEARSLMLSVAAGLFAWSEPLEQVAQQLEQRGIFDDLHDIQAYYTQRGGLFLGAYDRQRLVGTGAVCPLQEETCELKRLWLLPEYWGCGIGYALLQELLAHARAQGWRRMRLSTDRQQQRAVGFYRRLGFYDIPAYRQHQDEDDLFMELELGV